MPMSELAVSAPVAHASFGHGNAFTFNAKKADDDAMSIITGGAPPSSEPVSELAISAPVQHASGISAQNEHLLSILGGIGDSPSPSMSAVAIRAPVRRTQYTPPAQQYSRGPMSYNPRKADDDIMSMISGDSSPSDAGQVSQPSMIKQSSYLSQINFPMKQRVQEQEPAQVPHAGNSLGSFSWDEYGDVASGRVQVRPVQTQYIQQQVEDSVDDSRLQQMNQNYESSKVKGPLSSWLTPKYEAPDAQKPKVEETESESVSYDKKDPNDSMSMDNYINWAHSGAFQ